MFLFYDQCIVNGGFFDNFEYYYLIKKRFQECNVVFRLLTDHPKEDVIKILTDKYENIEEEVFEHILIGPYFCGKLLREPISCPDILFCATNSAIFWILQNGNLLSAKFYLGLADYKDIHSKQNKVYKNNLTLADERVFDYKDINWKPYRKKILFDKFRKKEYSSKYDYIFNVSLVARRYPKEFMISIFNELNGTIALYTGQKNKEYYSWVKEEGYAELIIPPVDDFMGLFKTFVYLPYNDGFDATPRLIPECKFYGKDVLYFNEVEIKSGGYYRYKDTVEDFKGLFLNENDEVVKIIESILEEKYDSAFTLL
jgi:hypothetical protein